MKIDGVLYFLGWASLTYSWLESNRLFFNALADAINEDDKQIKQKELENVKECIRRNTNKDKSVDEGEDENEDESEDARVKIIVKTSVKQ